MELLLAQTTDTLSDGQAAAAAAGVGIFVIVLGVVYLVIFVWMIVAIVDVNKYPDQAWAAAGQNKQTWLILNILALFVCFLITLYYWFAVRPKVKAAAGM